jgi:lipopolysaccharide transport system ATP-binding protein
MEAALSGFQGLRSLETFWALREVSFSVAPGEMLGIIGQNGAGKSTLLQLLGGVGMPDEGKIKINGRIGALLDLGAGFSTDLTGRENVFVNGVVAGLTRQEVAQRLDEIVTFAELEDFIDNPVRTYSTGMMMRLAFSTAIHTEPDIMLVDEFLSVGDLSFQGKCLERITQLKDQGCAIVLVSHSPDQVQELCDRALWLKRGNVVAYGEPAVVAGQYTMEMRSQTQKLTPHCPPKITSAGTELRVNENRFGSLEVEIADVRLIPKSILKPGEPISLEIDYKTNQVIESAIFTVAISHEDGSSYLDVNTLNMGLPWVKLQEQGTIRLAIDRLDLRGGNYFVDVGIYQQDWDYAYDYHWHAYPLVIDSSIVSDGVLAPPMRWEAIAAVTKKL